MPHPILTALAALVVALPAQAQVYKCTDPATGQPVFSQVQCAPDAATVEVQIHTPTDQQRMEHDRRVREGQAWVDDNRRQRAELIRARELEAAKVRAEQASTKTLDRLGTPSAVYRSGGYERRTYHTDKGIQSVTIQDGVITDTSTYRRTR